jgi:hypothetical protein
MTNKKKVVGILVLVLILGMMFIGCTLPDIGIQPEQQEQEAPLKKRVPFEPLESNLAKALWHQIIAVEDVIETVEKYVDIPEQESARSAGNVMIGLEGIGRYLPDDLSTLTRTKVQLAGRSASDEVTISLQDELNEILASYEHEMRLLVPDLENQDYGEMAFMRMG